MSNLIRALMLLFLPLAAQAQEKDAVTYFDVMTPRPFGYVIGDVIRHRVRIAVAKPYTLEKGTLPAKGQLSYWLDLQDVRLSEEDRDAETRYEIDLIYQTFYAPLEALPRTIPGYMLRFRGGNKSFDVPIESWDFTMSPLRELMAREVEGRAYMRPDTPPPLIDTSSYPGRLTILALTVVSLLAYLLYYYAIWPFHVRARRPFARATRKVRGIKRRSDAATAYRQAIREVHGAFNETYGRPLFVESVHRFVAQHPAFRPLLTDIETFFARSQETFFSDRFSAVASAYPLETIERFCHALKMAERQAA
ncbi:MAG: hypothetical protein ACREVE_14245 [Gammaproteobacteria bacterium]